MQQRFQFIWVIVFLLGTAGVMSACGKKGALYLPDDAKSKPARSQPSEK